VTPPVAAVPEISLQDPPRIQVVTGGAAPLPLGVRRRNFPGPVRVTAVAADLPRGVTIPSGELAEGEESATVQVAATAEAVPGTYRVRLQAKGAGNDDAGPAASALVEVTVLFLPPGFEKVGDRIVTDGKGVGYYERIERVLPDGTRVGFVLVPQASQEERLKRRVDPDTFYIMEDKVSLGLFRKFAEQFPDLVSAARKWDKKDAELRWPVFDVGVVEAYQFARRWMRGNLPTVEQWDKAAGRYEGKGRGAGPFLPDWKEPGKGIAIDRMAPLPVGEAKGDRSPYGCRDMAGNGTEWTRTLRDGKSVPLDDPQSKEGVVLRGRSYAEPGPLTFKDLETGFPFAWAYSSTLPELGFRVVIEPR
jgi:hypothetical protein